MSRPKYIAEGFHEDVGKLLNEYIDRSTTEFSEFASIWRKHNFSLIFMGRPDHTETTEFVNETFRITTQFLSSPSFYQQVGAVYVLYALFRNQISVPAIKIRIEINQWRVVKSLHIEAALRKYKSLHYVIDYLIKHAFVYVAYQTLKGPLIGSMQKITKSHEIVSNLKTNYKSEIMHYSISNNLVALRDLHAQYLEEKKNVGSQANVHLNDNSEIYEKFANELHETVHPKKIKVSESLGSRRAKIKAQSFMGKTKDRFGRHAEDDDDSESDPDSDFGTVAEKKRPFRQKRVPKHERRVGRPSKKPKIEPPSEPKSDDDIDISHLLPQQQHFYLPPAENEYRKSRTRRDPYYKVSPKKEEDNNSSDADEPI